ncbi:signal transduction histidine kinase [Streptosporangium sandarakinum]|uniref:histidine kinase n=1 Tax=Streptosporangium sandarakinum TaxID=1260955 RepID=A0A852UT54_9ACTN|nr:signal transduction histidine kinase [Streptosporangium sandarakinum]
MRDPRLRTKVTALLVSLVALWAFTAWVTVRDGLNMLGVATLSTEVADPGEQLIVALQAERRLTAVTLGRPGGPRQRQQALATQRGRTDKATANFRTLTAGRAVELLGGDALGRHLDETRRLLDDLAAARAAIDNGQMDRARAAAMFTGIVDAVFRVYDSMATLDDEEIAGDTRALIRMNRARDLLAQEDALVAGALTAGRLTGAERVQLTQLVGNRQLLITQSMDELPDSDRDAHRRLSEGQQFTRLRSLETLLIGNDQAVPAGLVDAQQWSAVAQPAHSRLAEAVLASGAGVVERSGPVATGVIVRLALAGGLGLIAVIASIVLAITTARALIRQLEKLRDAARELADERLPSVVERIGHGQDVDVAAEAPELEFGSDQIGQVGQAFNAVQRTAIKVAAEQAQLRRDIADILRNLARRTQSLVHRQLSVLDVMERRENDPQELRDLFRLDHLATRMRRYAENLLVLAGASPGRAWRDSVPMIDVVRGALAEIEDYTRVDVLPLGDANLEGRAVGDVIHLVAELVENAASFSPPYTTVQVSGGVVAHGYALEIEDRGLGMSPEDIAAANERIANPPELKLAGNARLGLYVVSRLAERHEIRVAFKISPYGGTTVVVLIPQELVSDGEDGGRDRSGDAGIPAGVTVENSVRVPEAVFSAAPRAGLPAEPSPAAVSSAPGSAFRESRTRESARRAAEVVRTAPVTGERDGDGGDGEPVAARRAAADTPAAPPVLPPPDTSHTPGGLPRRVPQTNLAAPLQEERPWPAEPQEAAEPGDGEPSPDAIRAAMASFQAGTRRGRSEAAQLISDEGDPADGPFREQDR